MTSLKGEIALVVESAPAAVVLALDRATPRCQPQLGRVY